MSSGLRSTGGIVVRGEAERALLRIDVKDRVVRVCGDCRAHVRELECPHLDRQCSLACPLIALWDSERADMPGLVCRGFGRPVILGLFDPETVSLDVIAELRQASDLQAQLDAEGIRALLGEYGTVTPFSTFLASERTGNGPREDLADLAGVRFVAASEVGSGRRLDEATIKALTGGEPVKARHLYRDLFEFVPTFKIWLSVNKKPQIRDCDEAIWRRVRTIPFNVTIPEERRDPHLGDRLMQELSGILSWAIQGVLEKQKIGLGHPRSVREAGREYREDQDRLGEFLSAHVSPNPGAYTSSAELFAVYRNWCEKTGEKQLSQRSLGLQLKDRGYRVVRNKHARGWDGVAVTGDT